MKQVRKPCLKHKDAEGKNPELDKVMADLLYKQGGPGRHKCTYCAYEIGFEEGRKQGYEDAKKETKEGVPA